MGRNLDSRRFSDDWFEKHDKDVAKLGEALGKTIRHAAKDRTITRLAKDIHYTRTTLTTLLNQTADDPKQRGWSLSTMLAIAGALGVPLSVLIAEAEAVAEGAKPGMNIRIASTEPRSQARMQKLIYEAVDYSGDTDEREYDELLEVLYRAADVVYVVPDMWAQYQGGLLSDDDVLALFKKAVKSAANEEPQPPFWAAVQREWNEVANTDAKYDAKN